MAKVGGICKWKNLFLMACYFFITSEFYVLICSFEIILSFELGSALMFLVTLGKFYLIFSC